MKHASTKPEQPLSCCPFCGGAWLKTGRGKEIYCENDCDLPESCGRIPDVPEVG